MLESVQSVLNELTKITCHTLITVFVLDVRFLGKVMFGALFMSFGRTWKKVNQERKMETGF